VNFTSLMHVSDWLPTILSATLLPIPEMDYQLDGVSQWDAIVSTSKGVVTEGRRQEVLIFWDPLPIAFNGNVGDAPKSAIRVDQYKLILGPPGCVSRA
jgi:arylsulfatase A-like enzyme